jgi:23S rRNA (guanosine2251-2'-O)-methyltransferase
LGDLLYGRNAVLEALRANRRRAYYLAVARGPQSGASLEAILALAEERNISIREVEREELDRLSAGNQGVALQVSAYPYADFDELVATIGPQSLFLLLDCIEDPQNLGTLLRTAEAAQVGAVVIPERRAAGVTPAVSNASAGAVEYLPVAQVGNLVQAMEQLRAAGMWLVGVEDVPEARIYDSLNWQGPMALIVGSEGAGVRRLVRERCDLLVRLPMAGRIHSLNAAVAGSIVLYQAWRGRTTA